MDPQAREGEVARAQEIADLLHALDVSTVALAFVDNSGVTRVKTIPTSRLPEAAVSGVGMSPVFDFFLVDDEVAPEGSPVGDLRLVPDLSRVTALPPQPGLAWSPVDRYTQDGEHHPGCQRTFARHMAQRVHERGFEMQMGFEVEWAVGADDGEGHFVPACRGPAYGMDRLAELGGYVTELQGAFAAEDIHVLQIHPEYGPGQFEVSVAPADPVTAADIAMLVRETIRSLSYAYEMRASFAPVVVAGDVGNGNHLHLSLWRDGENQLSSGEGRYGLSSEAEGFLASVLAELPALMAVGAPSVSSYLRLAPSHWAGAYQCWGRENREAAVRLITGSTHERGQSANVEIKSFDPAANPYLLVGSVLAAGLRGLLNGGALPEETTVDPATLSDRERRRRGIERLPQDLQSALDQLASSRLLAEAMGAPLFESFLAVRRAELAAFADGTDDEVVAATRWRY